MTNRTVRIIILLVGSLFLNIEAAHAGLINKLKIYIRQEFPDHELLYITGGILVFGILSYIIFTPVPIGREKWVWYQYFSSARRTPDYHTRREFVKRASGILHTSPTPKS